MNDQLSLSIFTIEVDRKPVLALRGRKHAEVQHVVSDEKVRFQLAALRSDGKPLCDDYSILRIRISRPAERQIFFDNPASILTSDGKLAVVLPVLDEQL